jgi:hypothetical protein
MQSATTAGGKRIVESWKFRVSKRTKAAEIGE